MSENIFNMLLFFGTLLLYGSGVSVVCCFLGKSGLYTDAFISTNNRSFRTKKQIAQHE